MADSPAFDFVCSELEQRSNLDRLEARGTVRLALREAGLEARSVTPDQMKVVVERVLPKELTTRGIADADAVCSRLKQGLSQVQMGARSESPDSVFERLGG